MISKEELFSRYSDPVETPEALESIVGKPIHNGVTMKLDRLDDIYRKFIEASPFCLMATSDPDGAIDISPKGDPKGFVKILEDNLLAIPDRPGNRRADSFHNLMKDPRMGLIFIIPGKLETVRLSGQARIVQDKDLRESLAFGGKPPKMAVLFYIEQAFMHCPKCMIRSHLWDPGSWTDASAIPDIGSTIIKQANLDVPLEKLTDEVAKQGGLDLY